MTIPTFDIKMLVEAGVHFGHQTRRRNPKMNKYIYGARNKVSIIDVRKTAPMLQTALAFLERLASSNGQILFVGTKSQASDKVREMAEKTGQFYVNNRWLGGLLTNFKTVSKSLKKLEQIEKTLEEAGDMSYTKKEKLNMTRQRDKLLFSLGGIRKMHRPAALVVFDILREKLAIAEAKTLGIPVVAICDTNCDPVDVDYIIPGNDDSTKAIALYGELFSQSILSGLEKYLSHMDKGVVEKELTGEKTEKLTEEKPVAKKIVKKTEEKPEAIKSEEK
ncbi:MAG: 30S ribosomal protein S2 [Alphaproteobacteria bacterium]|nr:30S ribosomal protein S2 [Alphaproteobacteria bacterium]